MVDPEIAEAYAILWALKLAKTEKFPKIIVERDSKLCEAINGNPEKANWKINAICFYVNRLALEFVSCCFSWAKKDANGTAHELANIATPLNSDFSCNASSLPPSLC